MPFVGYPEPARPDLRAAWQQRQATYPRVDAIDEARLADGGSRLADRGVGYRAAYAFAEENLKSGRTEIADCVTP